MSARYLPFNVTAASPESTQWNPHGNLGVAAIDADWADANPAVFQGIWRTRTNIAKVFRQWQDETTRDDEGRRCTVTEQLAHRVMGVPPGVPFLFVNGDSLDCRKENLKQCSYSEMLEANKRLAPWSVVSGLEGAREALTQLQLAPHAALVNIKRTRASRLSTEQVLRLLDEVKAGALAGQSPRSIAEWVAAEWGVQLWPQHLTRILRGQSQAIPGYDYPALLTARPTRFMKNLKKFQRRIAAEEMIKTAKAYQAVKEGKL